METPVTRSLIQKLESLKSPVSHMNDSVRNSAIDEAVRIVERHWQSYVPPEPLIHTTLIEALEALKLAAEALELEFGPRFPAYEQINHVLRQHTPRPGSTNYECKICGNRWEVACIYGIYEGRTYRLTTSSDDICQVCGEKALRADNATVAQKTGVSRTDNANKEPVLITRIMTGEAALHDRTDNANINNTGVDLTHGPSNSDLQTAKGVLRESGKKIKHILDCTDNAEVDERAEFEKSKRQFSDISEEYIHAKSNLEDKMLEFGMTDWDKVWCDPYDGSIEFGEVEADNRLSKEAQEYLASEGFCRCWLNHKDDMETYYKLDGSEGSRRPSPPHRIALRPAKPAAVSLQQLVDDVEEYLHWRKVNPQIKGGENYMKRFREYFESQGVNVEWSES